MRREFWNKKLKSVSLELSTQKERSYEEWKLQADYFNILQQTQIEAIHR